MFPFKNASGFWVLKFVRVFFQTKLIFMVSDKFFQKNEKFKLDNLCDFLYEIATGLSGRC
jgi:hypothetical protein